MIEISFWQALLAFVCFGAFVILEALIVTHCNQVTKTGRPTMQSLSPLRPTPPAPERPARVTPDDIMYAIGAIAQQDEEREREEARRNQTSGEPPLPE